ncbi:MAG: helix-turn-helix domain-containing protein [Cyanobacteriota bacterium]|nr:helix-turn-helix domain-containing protein [Cyanobacteriota bacterium]
MTEVAELWRVHRITVQRWLKQYSNGGRVRIIKAAPLDWETSE